MREEFAPGCEIGCGVALFATRNLAENYACARLSDAIDFAKAGGNLLAGHNQKNIVADDYGGAAIRQRLHVRQALSDIQAQAPQDGDLFFGREQADRASDANLLCDLEHRAIAATDVDEFVFRAESGGLRNLFVNPPRDIFEVTPAQGKIVRIAGMLRDLATILDVVIGAGQHGAGLILLWNVDRSGHRG